MSHEASIGTCSAALLDLLEGHGIELLLSIPGVHTIELYRTMQGRRLRHVTPRHEQGAAMIALGYAFATGRPAACAVITGPGLLNAATGIAEAYADSHPMVVVAAGSKLGELGLGAGTLHEMKSQHAVEQQIAGFAHLLLDPETIGEVVNRAFSLLRNQRPRPVIIEIPRDLLEAPVSSPQVARKAGSRPAPEQDAARRIGCLLEHSRSPMLIVGGGAVEASGSVTRLIERYAMPVVSSIAGKGVVSERHPLSLGASLPFSSTQQALAAADVVIAIGTELSSADLLFTGRTYSFSGKLVRIDIDPHQLMASFQPCEALLSDADAAVEAILQLGGTSADDRLHEERCSAAEKIRAALESEWPPGSKAHKTVLDVLRSVAADDAVICADSTQLAYTGNHYFKCAHPRTWLFPTGFGTLGTAVPTAIGAKIGRPEAQVAAIVGDGGFLVTIEELTTAVEQRLGFPIILWNNQAYGEIRDSMVERDMSPIGVELYTPDLMKIARGFGCETVDCRSSSALANQLSLAFLRSVPTLIHIDTKTFSP